VRGRIGYAWGNGAVLTYATGGPTCDEDKFDGTRSASGMERAGVPLSATRATNHSNVNTGWTVGCGMKGRLTIPGWTWKVEYLYLDLGSLNEVVSRQVV
jgi:opacity protein-like surface antigen